MTQEIKWFKVGSLHEWFRADGFEIEVGRTGLQADQQDGMRWPAQYEDQDNIAAKAMWIGTSNYTDAPQYGGITYPYKVVHLGPRGYDPEREFMPVEFKMYGKFDHPLVYVDGVTGSELMWDEVLDGTDENLQFDRMIYNVVNTSVGITMTRKIYTSAQQYHDNYFITEYIFKNTGNVDPDEDIEQPDKTLTDVWFYFQSRYAISREGADATDLNSPRWGINTMLSTRGEAKASDGAQYTGDYENWLNGDTDADSLRAQFAWMGQHSQATHDLLAGPDVRYKTGRFMSPQFIGTVTLHADTSPDDPTDDPQQPTTTSHQQSDDPETRPNDQFDASRMAEEWEWMTRGHRFPRHDERVGTDGFPDQLEGTPGGFSNCNGYGPYTLAPGDSVRIIVAEGVSGLNRQLCEELGEQWYAKYANPDTSIAFELPDGSTTNDENEFKNKWFFTGEDSLFKTFGRARRGFESGYQVPSPPPPPDLFDVNSGGDRIALTWASNAESYPGFAGYRLYRAVAKYDTTYEKIFECGSGTEAPAIINEFNDTSAIRGFSYYYYVTSFDDGNTNVASITNPSGELESSMFWTRTIEPAKLKRPATADMDSIRIVPNPYNIRAKEFQYPGEPDKIMFLNIPGTCKIQIFTERGDLIHTIEHSDGSGDEEWNSTTEFGQVIVSGVYLVVFTTD
ncbi:fibronectin, partial [bacterium]|nr:fibronectin [bacterium]